MVRRMSYILSALSALHDKASSTMGRVWKARSGGWERRAVFSRAGTPGGGDSEEDRLVDPVGRDPVGALREPKRLEPTI